MTITEKDNIEKEANKIMAMETLTMKLEELIPRKIKKIKLTEKQMIVEFLDRCLERNQKGNLIKAKIDRS